MKRSDRSCRSVLDAFPHYRRYEWYPVHDAVAVAVAELVRQGLLTTEYVNVLADWSPEHSRGRTLG
jgi:inosine-uridine nucleoside N-ribohydrolase